MSKRYPIKSAPLSLEEMRALFYNDGQGNVRNKINRNSKSRKDAIAGRVSYHGYRETVINKKMYRLHVIAWYLHTGEWKPGLLDHKDGNKLNNAVSNLRVITCAAENNRNRGKTPTNNTGHVGVYWCKRRRKWRTFVTHEGKTLKLGDFDDWRSACLQSRTARILLGFSDRHSCVNEPIPPEPLHLKVVAQ